MRISTACESAIEGWFQGRRLWSVEDGAKAKEGEGNSDKRSSGR